MFSKLKIKIKRAAEMLPLNTSQGFSDGFFRWVFPMGFSDGFFRWVFPMGFSDGFFRWVFPMG